MVLEYDGTAYHGWQIQPEVPTVQGTVQAALRRLLQEPVRVVGAGRTDAGVHALGQVAHFHTRSTVEVERLRRALNALLPPDIAVRQLEEVPPGFHARRDATGRTYRYLIHRSDTPSALLRRYSWWVPVELDVERMRQASRYLLGWHDFSAFGTPPGSNPWREVRRVELQRAGSLLAFEVEANAFLRGMVRTMVGLLVEVGRGRLTPEGFGALLRPGQTRSPRSAPPQGLFLVRVSYR